MTGIKRWLAAILAGMLLFSCAAASAEENGRDTVDIQESLVSREGEETRTLGDHILELAALMQKEEVRNLLKIEDVSTITSEVISKILAWMWNNRPVTMKILAEFGVRESDLRSVEKLWDSAERLSAAFRDHESSEHGKQLSADVDALMEDPDFIRSVNDLRMLLSSEDLAGIVGALQEAASGQADLTEGPLTKAALEQEVNRTTFTGSLLLSLLGVLDQSEWARNSLPGLLMNENLWRVLKDLSEGDEELDRVVREEFTLLSEDPEITGFLQSTLSAVPDLLNILHSPDAGSGKNGNHSPEETEVSAP